MLSFLFYDTINFIIKYAVMAELADALDLGSSSKEWRFKSSWSHHQPNVGRLSDDNSAIKIRLPKISYFWEKGTNKRMIRLLTIDKS